MTRMITVSLVEDDPGVRASLASLLDDTPGFTCRAAYPDGMSALEGIPKNCPDVVLMDINLPGMLGSECVRQLKALLPDLPVLMLRGVDSDLVLPETVSQMQLRGPGARGLLQTVEVPGCGHAPALNVPQHWAWLTHFWG